MPCTWCPTTSNMGASLPLSRYARPNSRPNRVGECETFLTASGLPFPRGAVEGAITLMPERVSWSTSQHRARSAWYAAGAALDPSELNCGLQKKVLFGSFQIV